MNLRLVQGLLATILVPWLVACGGGSLPLATNQAAVGVLGQLNTALAVLPQSNTVPSLPVGGGITTSSTDVTPASLSTCQTINPDPTVDADGDNIAEEKVYSFDCTDVDDGTDTVTRKGSLSIYDLDETVAGLKGGLKVNFDIDAFNYNSADGSEYDATYHGTWLYDWEGSNFVFNTDFDGTFAYKTPSNPSGSRFDFSYMFDYKATPLDEANPFVAGTVSFSGEFVFEGEFEDEQSGEKVSGKWAVSIYSSSLIYDNTCSKYFQQGSIFVDDGNGNVFEYRYSCSSAAVFKNGAEFTDVSI